MHCVVLQENSLALLRIEQNWQNKFNKIQSEKTYTDCISKVISNFSQVPKWVIGITYKHNLNRIVTYEYYSILQYMSCPQTD